MPVVVQLAISRRTLSKVRPQHVQRADQLREAGGVLLAGLVGGEARVQLLAERLGHQPAERRVDVGEARDERLGIARSVEVHLGQLAADVQGVDHGAEAVEVGAGVGLAVARRQLRRGVQRAAHRSVRAAAAAAAGRPGRSAAPGRPARRRRCRAESLPGWRWTGAGVCSVSATWPASRSAARSVGVGIVPGVPQDAAVGDLLDEVFEVVFGEGGDDVRQAGMLQRVQQARLPGDARPVRPGRQDLGGRSTAVGEKSSKPGRISSSSASPSAAARRIGSAVGDRLGRRRQRLRGRSTTGAGGVRAVIEAAEALHALALARPSRRPRSGLAAGRPAPAATRPAGRRRRPARPARNNSRNPRQYGFLPTCGDWQTGQGIGAGRGGDGRRLDPASPQRLRRRAAPSARRRRRGSATGIAGGGGGCTSQVGRRSSAAASSVGFTESTCAFRSSSSRCHEARRSRS